MTVLRQVATDNDYVKKRLVVLERWMQAGELEPWMCVVMAEWIRSAQHTKGEPPTIDQFEALFLDQEVFEAMREQVDGPWMIYAEQARAQRSNNLVMGFLQELDAIVGKAD